MFVCSQTRMMTSTISLRTSKTRTVLKGYSMRTAFSGAMIGWAASSLCRWSFFSCLGWDYLATVYYKPDSSRYSKRLKTNQNDLEILHQTFYQWSFQGAVVDLVKNEQESPFTFPDVPVAKIQGVRAAKSESWLKRTETISEIASAIMSTEPVFRLSTWFLQQQEEQTWLSDNPSNRPIVNLVTPRFSPVVKAIASCFDMLVNPGSDDGPLQFLDGNLECGKDQWWCCVHS